jgi:hypothetical protein
MAEDTKPPKPFIPPESNEETRLYWDRLDAKFANLHQQPSPASTSWLSRLRTQATPPAAPEAAAAPAPAPPAAPEAAAAPAPAPPAAPETAAAPAPAPPAVVAPLPAATPHGLVAEAFAALLALEDGRPGARPVRLAIGDAHPPPPAEPRITDAAIEDIVRRVIERLGPDAVRAVVADVVSEIAERRVNEEIERIRKQHV